jgi:two-component sensor histidine kinase
VGTVFNVPETKLDIDTATPLGLIMNELFTNAFKYAFNPGKKGYLSVSLVTQSAGYLLTVHDNGPGLQQERLETYTTLGMRLVSLLAAQLGGYTEYTYEHGSVFSIYFKDTNERKKEL